MALGFPLSRSPNAKQYHFCPGGGRPWQVAGPALGSAAVAPHSPSMNGRLCVPPNGRSPATIALWAGTDPCLPSCSLGTAQNHPPDPRQRQVDCGLPLTPQSDFFFNLVNRRGWVVGPAPPPPGGVGLAEWATS